MDKINKSVIEFRRQFTEGEAVPNQLEGVFTTFVPKIMVKNAGMPSGPGALSLPIKNMAALSSSWLIGSFKLSRR